MSKQCEYCKNKAIKKVYGAVDGDIDDEGEPVAIYGNMWLCKGHLEDWENREGLWDEYKYR